MGPLTPVLVAVMKVGYFVAEVAMGAAFAGGLGGVAALAIGAAVVVGGYALTKSFFEVEMPTVDTDASRQRTVKSTTEPQKIVYGEALVSGPISFIGLSGVDNSDLYQSIVLAGHQVTAITNIHMDDEIILNNQIDGSGNVTGGKFGPKGSPLSTICVISKHLGVATETADSLLTPFANYTANHRGDGLAYIVTKWTLNADSSDTWEKYSPSNVKALVQGKAVFDPRTNTTAYSTNPALCVIDYLTDTYLGMGIPSSKIDWDAVEVAADGCDALVNVPGGQESRFTCNGVLFCTDSHQKNINKILSAMNGSLVFSNGKYIVRAGIPETAAITLDENDLRGSISLKTSLEASARVNTVKGLFIDPAQNHKSTEFPKVQIQTALERDNNRVMEKEVQFPMTNSSYMAQRLAHKTIQRENLQKVITFPANYSALRIASGDRVNVKVEELGWTQELYECVGWTFSEEGGVSLTLREDSPFAYADPLVAEYSTVSATGVITDAFRGVPAPSALSGISSENKVYLNWTNPEKPDDYNTIHVFYSDTPDFVDSVKLGETDGDEYIHGGLTAGETKYYWVRAVKNKDLQSILNPPTAGVGVLVVDVLVDWDNVASPTIGIDLTNDTISIDLGSTGSTTGRDVAQSGISEDVTISSGGILMNGGGAIRGGQSAYNSGTGFFLGYDTDAYKFSIGNASDQFLKFDGQDFTISGNITATSLALESGVTIGSSNLDTAVQTSLGLADNSNQDSTTDIRAGTTAEDIGYSGPLSGGGFVSVVKPGYGHFDGLSDTSGFGTSLQGIPSTRSFDTSIFRVGTQSIKQNGNTGGVGFYSPANTLNLIPGRKWMMTFWVRATSTLGVWNVGIHDSVGLTNGTSTALSAANAWEFKAAVVDLTSSTSSTGYYRIYNNNFTSGSAYFDAISIFDITEASSVTVGNVSQNYFSPLAQAVSIDTDKVNGIEASIVQSGAQAGSTAIQDNTFGLTLGLQAGSAGPITISYTPADGGDPEVAKLYQGTGTFNNANTGFYLDNSGNFSLQDKLAFNGSTLSVDGDIVAENLTITEANITGTLTLGGGVLQDGSGNNLTTTTTLNANQAMSDVSGVLSQTQHLIPSFYRITTDTDVAPTNAEFNTIALRLPKINDIVITTDTTVTDPVTPNRTYGWTCTVAGTVSTEATWVEVTDFIAGNLLVNGTITADQIDADSISAAVITAGGIVVADDISAFITGTEVNANVTSISGGAISTGTVNAARIDVAGVITAGSLITESATIANNIRIGSGDSVFSADSLGIYLGNETFADAEFSVTPEGVLTATGADISGAITATSGSIANSVTIGGTAASTVESGALAGATANQDSTATILAGNLTGQVDGTAVATIKSGAEAGATAVQDSDTGLTLGLQAGSAGPVTISYTAASGGDPEVAKLYQGTGTFNNSNTGFYLDNSGNFSLQDKLAFNGSTLAVSGDITATSLTLSEGITIAKSVVGLTNVDDVSAATIQSDTLAAATSADVGLDQVTNVSASTIQSNTLTAATSSDVGLANVENLDAQDQAQTGLIAGTTITGGGITMSSGGSVKGGATEYADVSNAGFFIGYDTDAYKLSVGDANNYLRWNGTGLDIKGTITVGSTELTESNTLNTNATAADVGLDLVTNVSAATILDSNHTGTVNNVSASTVTSGAAAGATASQVNAGLALLLNKDTYGNDNTGEASLVSVDKDGVPILETSSITSNGFIQWNGSKITVEAVQYTSTSTVKFTVLTGLSAKRGFIVFDTTKSNPFTVDGVAMDVAFAFKEGSQWFYDNNSTATTFTPTNDMVALGYLETGAGDTILKGGLINPVTLTAAAFPSDEIKSGSIGGIKINGDSIFAGAGNWTNTDTGFYLDNTGKFSLKDKVFYDPSQNKFRVQGTVEADVLQVNSEFILFGNSLKQQILTDGSISGSMLSQDAINILQGTLATSTGGSNGDFKSETGTFTTSGGSIVLGTSGDLFNHGELSVDLEANFSISWNTTTNYGIQSFNLQFQISTDGTNYTNIGTGHSIQITTYDLSQYYAGNYYVHYSYTDILETIPASSFVDNTDYYIRALVSNVPTSVTGQSPEFTFSANEGVTGVTSTGGNADTLDNLDSTAFLRSNVDDTFDANLTVTGNLTVQGTTTTVDTDNLTVKDNNITLNYSAGDSSSTAGDAGITIQDAVDASTDASILWKTASNTFAFSHGVTWPSGSSTNANTAYTYSQVGHLPLTGGTLTTSGSTPLTLRSGNALGSVINFSDQDTELQQGNIKYFHQDTQSYGSGNAFVIDGTEDSMTVLADGKLMFKEGLYVKPATGTGAGTLLISSSGNLTNIGTITATGGTSTEWNTAYTYSQVGHLPLTGGTLTVVNAGDATLLTLHHDTGADISQQKSFIDFSFEDDNPNETPQVRIGAEVGPNGDANSQTLEGSGAFVVYTNNATTDSGAATGLSERFRVDYLGNTTVTGTISSGAISSGDITIAVDDTPTLNFKKASSADVLASINVTTDAGTGGKLVIQTKRNGDTAVDRLTINDDGNATFSGTISSGAITSTGDLTIPAKIIHSGDLDTYLEFSADDQFRIVAGGAEVTQWTGTQMEMNKSITWSNWVDFSESAVTGFGFSELNAPIHLPAVNVGSVDKYLPFLQGSALHAEGYRSSYVFGAFKQGTTGAGWGDGQSGFFMAMGGADTNPTTEFRFSWDGHIWHSTGTSDTYIDFGLAADTLSFRTGGTERLKLDSSGATIPGATFTGGISSNSPITTTSRIEAQYYNSIGGQELILTAGESIAQLQGVTGGNPLQNEYVYAVAESGLTVISSPNNWINGADSYNDVTWAERNTAIINDVNGDSSFPGSITALDLIVGTYSTTATGSLYLTGSTASKQAVLKCTNGNLHMDANSGNSMYLNYYSGSGIVFGNGASGTNASIAANGNFTTSGTISSGVITSTGLDMSATASGWAHLNQSSFITFFGNGSDNHAIGSRNNAGTASDAIRINSYGAVFINLDSNNNNASGADFKIGRHGSGVGAIDLLLSVSGENGNLISEGNITAYGSASDIRLKDNVQRIADPIEKVKQLDGVTFNYKKDGSESTGLIAQQLLEVLPQVVYETKDLNDEETHYAVRYGQVAGLLVEAIKEQQSEIEELKTFVKKLMEK